MAIDLAKNGYRGRSLPRFARLSARITLTVKPVVISGKIMSNAYDVGSTFSLNLNSPFSINNTVEREIRDFGGEGLAIVVDAKSFAST